LDSQTYIYGRNAVTEALIAGKKIEKIFMAFGLQGDSVSKIYSLSKKSRVQLVVYDKKKFAILEKQVCPDAFKSQGVIALMRDFEIFSLEDLVAAAYNKDQKPVLVILDEISDPQNLGAIARSAECSGAAGIILPERNSAPISPVAVKASAGALEYIPVCKVSSFPQTFEYLKDNGFWLIGTDANADRFYTDDVYDSPVAIVIGSEGKGLRPSTKNHCDVLIKIPMTGRVNSLNASVSAAIVLFEIVRQKGV